MPGVESSQPTQAQQAYAAQMEAYAKAEDAKVEALIPELDEKKTDKDSRAQFQKECFRTLELSGLTPSQISYAWHNDPTFRSAASQKMIADSTRWRLAQEKMKDVGQHKKQAPPPQRPGTEQPYGGMDQARENSAIEKLVSLRGNQAIDAAVKIMQARRQRG